MRFACFYAIMNPLPSLSSFFPFLSPSSLPSSFPFSSPGSDQKNSSKLYKKSAMSGRCRLELAKLFNRTRNKLQNFTNNVLLKPSDAIEHVGINCRVKGKGTCFHTVYLWNSEWVFSFFLMIKPNHCKSQHDDHSSLLRY